MDKFILWVRVHLFIHPSFTYIYIFIRAYRRGNYNKTRQVWFLIILRVCLHSLMCVHMSVYLCVCVCVCVCARMHVHACANPASMYPVARVYNEPTSLSSESNARSHYRTTAPKSPIKNTLCSYAGRVSRAITLQQRLDGRVSLRCCVRYR